MRFQNVLSIAAVLIGALSTTLLLTAANWDWEAFGAVATAVATVVALVFGTAGYLLELRRERDRLKARADRAAMLAAVLDVELTQLLVRLEQIQMVTTDKNLAANLEQVYSIAVMHVERSELPVLEASLSGLDVFTPLEASVIVRPALMLKDLRRSGVEELPKLYGTTTQRDLAKTLKLRQLRGFCLQYGKLAYVARLVLAPHVARVMEHKPPIAPDWIPDVPKGIEGWPLH